MKIFFKVYNLYDIFAIVILIIIVIIIVLLLNKFVSPYLNPKQKRIQLKDIIAY